MVQPEVVVLDELVVEFGEGEVGSGAEAEEAVAGGAPDFGAPEFSVIPNRSLDFGEIARLCHAACFSPSRRRSGLRRGVARNRMRTEAGKMPESLIFLTENSPGVSNDRFGVIQGLFGQESHPGEDRPGPGCLMSFFVFPLACICFQVKGNTYFHLFSNRDRPIITFIPV